MAKKYTLDFVKQRFLDGGCILLATEYTGSMVPMPYICSCGNQSVITLNNMYSGSRCAKCSGSARNKYSYEYVIKAFEDRGCILLSETYKNADTPLEYVCVCGNISTIRFGNLLQGSLCAVCSPKRIGKRNITHGKYSIYKDDSLPHSSVLSFSSNHVVFQCDCGRIERRVINGDSLGDKKVCTECLKLRRANGMARGCHDYRLWRAAVLASDNYACARCGSGSELRAHHLEPWALNKELRFIVGNGSTLCYMCHKEFHKLFGIKAGSKEFYAFLADTR